MPTNQGVCLRLLEAPVVEEAMTRPNHLVVVCGHGIWLGGPKKGWDESEWLIESYKAGETPTFIEHIRAGVNILAEDQAAVLAFSG